LPEMTSQKIILREKIKNFMTPQMQEISHVTPKFTPEMVGKIFYIDPSHADRSLDVFLLSTRARNILKFMGVEKLHDLKGISYEKVLESKNCGFKTYKDIVRFAKAFEYPAHAAPPQNNTPLFVSGRGLISIPEEARDWSLDLLPFSVRLRHVLVRLKCRTLSDLQGLSYNTLVEVPDCGVRTLNELRNFVNRVQKGKLGLPREQTGETHASFMVTKIDAFLVNLPPRQRDIFMSRVGARKDPLTLMRVGRKYNMTRERVRQIVELLIEGTLRFGGPPFACCLQEFTAELHKKLWPLTPALLEQMVGTRAKKPQYTWSFYIRLLGWLSPTLPVWPVGQTPAAYRTTEQEDIIGRLRKWFQGRTSPVKIEEVYRGITAGSFRCAPFEFLEALRFAAEFAIDMKDPCSPRIYPPVEAPRRWARQILAGTDDEASLPPEAFVRAKAILYARRAPRSKYRLASGRKF